MRIGQTVKPSLKEIVNFTISTIMRNIMKRKSTLDFARKLLKGKILLVTIGLICTTASILLMSNKDGPARNGNAVTGAPFNNNQSCNRSGCHSGGNFGGSITTALLDAGSVAVNSYEPGKSYTFRITMNKTSGTPQYGFQTTVAKSIGNTNINAWGALPLLTRNSTLQGRNYIEHTTRLTSNVINIPWTGPAAGTGTVIFYTSGNLVDAKNNTSGDQAVKTTLTITEASTLPVTLLYFRGATQNGKAVLSWATSQEINNRNFVIEKSADGSNYSQLAVIPVKGNTNGSTYSYTDEAFSNTAYYRLIQADLDGTTTTYNTVQVKAVSATNYTLSVYSHAGTSGLLFYNGMNTQKINIRLTSINGQVIRSYNTTANAGNNFFPVAAPAAKQVIIATITTEDGIRTSKKICIQ